jgi:hypothetical protein
MALAAGLWVNKTTIKVIANKYCEELVLAAPWNQAKLQYCGIKVGSILLCDSVSANLWPKV